MVGFNEILKTLGSILDRYQEKKKLGKLLLYWEPAHDKSIIQVKFKKIIHIFTWLIQINLSGVGTEGVGNLKILKFEKFTW